MKYLIIIGIIVILGLLSISPLIAYKTDTYVEDTVIEKERVLKNNSSKYLIFCENEVYENRDSIWYWKWDSSDFYKEMEEGKTYKFRVFGFRVPFLSWYRNIIEISK